MSRARQIVRTAPWRHAPGLLWRDRVLAALALAVAALAGLVAAATPLYASSVSVASFEQQLGPLCTPSAVWPSTRVPVDKVRGELATLSARSGVFGSPVESAVAAKRADTNSPPTISAAGGTALVAFATRTGFAEHLDTGGDVGDGLYLPASLAAAVGVRAGDTVTVNGGNASTLTLPVAGVFDDLTNHPRDPFWCALQPAVQPQISDEFSPSPTAVVDPALFDQLVADLGLRVTFTTWEAPIDVNLTDRAEAARAARAVDELREDAAPLRVSLASRLPFIVDRAAAMRESVAAGIMPVTILAAAAVAGLVAGVALFWSMRRRTELRLLWARGVPPWLLGVKGVLELGPVMAIGALAGWAIAWPLVNRFGPGSGVEPGVAWIGLAAAGVAAAISLLLAGIVVAVRVRVVPLAAHAGHTRTLPVWPFLAAALVWSWWRLSSLRLAVPDGDRLPPVPWETFVVPVVFLVSATTLAVLGLRWLLAIGARRARGLPTVAYLAVRRIAGASTIVLVLCAAAGLAIGVVTYGAGLAGSSQRTIDLKLGVGLGAPTEAYLLPSGIPPALEGRATTVVLRKARYAGEDVALLAVDPTTFADGAFWDSTFAGESLPSLLGRLGPAAADGSVPALLAGSAAPSGELSFPLFSPGTVPLRVVGRPTTFPGLDGTKPLVVVDAAAVSGPLARATPVLWTHAPEAEVREAAAASGQRVVTVTTPEGRLNTSMFQPVVWIARFVQAIGVLIAALAAGALLAYLGAGRRGRALAAELLRRMGLGAKRQWLVTAIELGMLALLALATGVAAGWASVAALRKLVDAAPAIPPAATLRFPMVAVGWAAAAGLLVVMVGAAVATLAAGRTRAAELLREDL